LRAVGAVLIGRRLGVGGGQRLPALRARGPLGGRLPLGPQPGQLAVVAGDRRARRGGRGRGVGPLGQDAGGDGTAGAEGRQGDHGDPAGATGASDRLTTVTRGVAGTEEQEGGPRGISTCAAVSTARGTAPLSPTRPSQTNGRGSDHSLSAFFSTGSSVRLSPVSGSKM